MIISSIKSDAFFFELKKSPTQKRWKALLTVQ